MRLFEKIDSKKIPLHVAFIMDGNGRWAEKKFLPRNFGHSAGVETVENIIKYSLEVGIKHLTFYAFSTENWKRDKKEVDGLFQIFRDYLNDKPDDYIKSGVRLNIIGDISKLPIDLQQSCADISEKTKHGNKMVLNLALNYGSRDEILRAVKLCIDKKLKVTEQSFAANLYTAGQPDPDIIIRTSGETRLSNFLLYQSAYSELYFAKSLWPAFTISEYKKALIWFQNKNRRFGGVDKNLKED